MKYLAEYIWLDGSECANIRSKTKVIDRDLCPFEPRDVPEWSFDGSSTNQAEGNDSDCILKPVKVYDLPRQYFKADILVLCEVMMTNGEPHPSNTRAKLREVHKRYENNETWFAFEQEYVLFNKNGTRPYRWPIESYPHPQGKYFCGVGADAAWGRHVSEIHLDACLRMDLPMCGTNAEVMPAQWEYQIGPRTALEISDDMWVSRFVFNRIAEEHDITIKLEPKPIIGDWNGSGCHVNFSTKQMRASLNEKHIKQIVARLEAAHDEHIRVYGHDNDSRLTGSHETCAIDEFKWGHSDRGASIRVPPVVKKDGRGYLEDRRPAANIDPYKVCEVLLNTICPIYDLAVNNR